jgi:hypothetical protein
MAIKGKKIKERSAYTKSLLAGRIYKNNPNLRSEMNTERPPVIAPIGLVVGAFLGLAGSFAPSASLRGLAWGIDGISLIVAAAVLAVHFLRRDSQLPAAGFLVFIAGETLVLSGSAMSLEAGAPSFAAGAGLWAAALLRCRSSLGAALPH